jgi:HEAT repeat protein
MNDLRTDLLRLIDLNRQERWVPADQALDQLAVHGEALIPGLVRALDDDDAEVRLLAVELLDAAGQRAEAAVPALVKKVADPDRLVRVAAASALAQFGPVAAAAVPFLEPWIEDENEYVRVIAATTILTVNPRMGAPLLLAKVKEGLYSKNPVVRSLAEEFFEKRPATITDAAKQQMAGKKSTDLVRLVLRLNDLHLWPQEEAQLHKLGCTFFMQTAFVASIEVPVEQVEALAKLPTIEEIR